MLRIRAFRAIDDIESCEKFSEGHTDVLKSYGIKKVTSANTEWFHNPGVYVILVETGEDFVAVGGARIHVSSPENDVPLPIEDAIGDLDHGIHALVRKYAKERTGEICGLWNAREVSGKGLSILLIRAGIAKSGLVIANQLKLNSLFGLCAPWTLDVMKNLGFSVEESLGDKGSFPYPRPDLLATVVIAKDTETLGTAARDEKKGIFNLREKPKQVRYEKGPKGDHMIDYNLYIPHLS